jgi:uncharacterized Zn-binding protein involved in type VI secretion
MFPAARIADPITHDMLVPSGIIGPPITGPCPKGVVLIEGLPAAHLNCTAICTGVISVGLAHPPPVPPAPPPPIILGSTSVLIHGMPAARWAPSGDMGACGVFLGNPMLSALRRVFIGGPVFPLSVTVLPNGNIQVGNNITIEGDAEFQAKVLRDLHIMSNFSTGAERLNNIDTDGQPVRIREGASNGCAADNWADASAAGTPANRGGVGTGRGSGSTITYNPDREPPTAADPTVRRPAEVGLHHELSHSEHIGRGDVDMSPDPANPNNPHVEETNTINQDNQYRTERGIPTRADHTVL